MNYFLLLLKRIIYFYYSDSSLQDVSREFKSTLEREIGLDDIQASNQNTYNSSISRNPSSPSSNSSSEASQKAIDPSELLTI